jgi:hypothetical protein
MGLAEIGVRSDLQKAGRRGCLLAVATTRLPHRFNPAGFVWHYRRSTLQAV